MSTSRGKGRRRAVRDSWVSSRDVWSGPKVDEEPVRCPAADKSQGVIWSGPRVDVGLVDLEEAQEVRAQVAELIQQQGPSWDAAKRDDLEKGGSRVGRQAPPRHEDVGERRSGNEGVKVQIAQRKCKRGCGGVGAGTARTWRAPPAPLRARRARAAPAGLPRPSRRRRSFSFSCTALRAGHRLGITIIISAGFLLSTFLLVLWRRPHSCTVLQSPPHGSLRPAGFAI